MSDQTKTGNRRGVISIPITDMNEGAVARTEVRPGPPAEPVMPPEETIMSENPREEIAQEADAQTEASAEAVPAPEAEVSAFADEAAVYRDKWMRTAADLDNLRKRTARDVDAARKYERQRILLDAITVLDSVERALDAQSGANDQWTQGVEGIHQQMLAFLKRFGVERFDAVGERFDPQRHEAVATVNLPDREEGVIAEVIAVGYQMGDGTLLRPAKVVAVRKT